MVSQLPRPYWLDEAFSVFVARQPVGTLVRYAANDIHPPAYFLLLRGWGTVFGFSEAATGVFSLALMVVAAWLVYRLGRTLADRWVGAAAVLLFWSSAATVNQATETRMYALVVVAALASTLALHRFATQGSRRAWWAWLVFSALGVSTHYFYWLLVYAQNFAVAGVLRLGYPRQLMRRWIAAQVVLVALVVAWLPTMVDRVLQKVVLADGNWLPEVTATFSQQVVAAFGTLTVNLPGLDFRWLTIGSPTVAAALVLIGVSAAVGQFELRRGTATYRLHPPTPAGVIIGASLLIPIVLLAAFGAMVPRYIAYAAAFAAVAAALLIRRLPRGVRGWVAVALALALVVGNWSYELRSGESRTLYRWPEVAAYLARYGPTSHSLILTAAYEEELVLRHYFDGSVPIQTFLPAEYQRAGDEVISRIRRIALANIRPDNVDEVVGVVAGYDTVWAVNGGGWYFADRSGSLQAWLGGHCKLDDIVEFVARPIDSAPLVVSRYSNCTRAPKPRALDSALSP